MFNVNRVLTYMVEQKQKEDKQGSERGGNIDENTEGKRFNPAMYKQVEDIGEPICCAVDRIAEDCCAWGCYKRN